MVPGEIVVKEDFDIWFDWSKTGFNNDLPPSLQYLSFLLRSNIFLLKRYTGFTPVSITKELGLLF